jgi:hypothetical protein
VRVPKIKKDLLLSKIELKWYIQSVYQSGKKTICKSLVQRSWKKRLGMGS